MRFSYWPAPTQPFEEVVELSNFAGDLGFSGIWFADHFMPDGKKTDAPWAEAWTTLSALSIAVPKLRGARKDGRHARPHLRWARGPGARLRMAGERASPVRNRVRNDSESARTPR